MLENNFVKNGFWIGLCLIVFLCSLSIDSKAATTTLEKRVAIIQIVEHPALNETLQGIKEVLEASGVKVQVQSAQGNSALAAQIAEQYVGSAPNALVGIGTTAAQALLAADQRYKIPVIFSSISDPLGSKLVKNLNHPEGMATGVSNFIEPSMQFEFFKELIPNLKTLGIIYNPGESNSVALVEKMQQVAKQQGLELVLASANSSTEVAQATQSLMRKVQAVFINNDNTALSAFDAIVKISNQNNIPVFSSDSDMLERGALATLGADQYEIGKQTALMVLKILNGEKLEKISVEFPKLNIKKFNQKQANKLKIQIPANLTSTL